MLICDSPAREREREQKGRSILRIEAVICGRFLRERCDAGTCSKEVIVAVANAVEEITGEAEELPRQQPLRGREYQPADQGAARTDGAARMSVCGTLRLV